MVIYKMLRVYTYATLQSEFYSISSDMLYLLCVKISQHLIFLFLRLIWESRNCKRKEQYFIKLKLLFSTCVLETVGFPWECLRRSLMRWEEMGKLYLKESLTLLYSFSHSLLKCMRVLGLPSSNCTLSNIVRPVLPPTPTNNVAVACASVHDPELSARQCMFLGR